MQQRRVNFHTLGCKLNFSESSTLAREFEQGGFVRVAPDAEADICVINSCSVTEHADKKCRNLIRKLHRRNPDAIIADEPTSALDVSVRAQILNLLTDLKKELGLAMVFISHDIQTVRYISDDIIVMNGGKIVEQGEAKQVFQHPQDPYTKMLLGAAPSLLHPKLGE